MATNEAIGGRISASPQIPGISPQAVPGAATGQAADTRWVRLAAQGDQAAFEYLYQSRVTKISRYVQAILSNTAAAEETVAEVFITAWRKLSKLREPERFDSWLYRIAHNHSMDSLRKRRDTEPLEKRAMLKPDPNPRNCPQGSLEISASEQIIKEALLRLPDDQREVITLRFLAEMSHSEVALQLGKSEEAVRALQYRGLKTLKARMNP